MIGFEKERDREIDREEKERERWGKDKVKKTEWLRWYKIEIASFDLFFLSETRF